MFTKLLQSRHFGVPKPIRWLLLLPLRNNPAAFTRAHRLLSGYERRLDRKIADAAINIDQWSSRFKSPCFIDCGFNEAVVLSKFQQNLPRFRFYGYEVQHDLFESAKAKLSNVELYNAAVWTEMGEIEVSISSSSTYNQRGGTSIIPNSLPDSKVYTRHMVPTRDFLRDLQELRNIHDYVVVKMDIEGAEYDVLNRVLETGEHLIDRLLIEFHPHIGGQDQHERILSMLSSSEIIVDNWY